MNLITGRTGAAHITPRQDAMWHQGLTETESCIFDAYENFAAEIITNNEVRIRSGVGMLQGRFFCIEPNTYDSADIANGTQGEYRKDLIVARITVDASTNTQSAAITVIQGTPAADNPVAPEAVTGDLDAGDLIADYPLVEVLLNGINIESITPVFDTGWLFNAVYPVGAVYISYVSTSPAELFGGTWTAITGVFPYFNAGTSTGGSNTHTLTTNQMPKHTHTTPAPATYANVSYTGTMTTYGNAWLGGTPSTFTSSSTGGESAHNNMPAYQTFYAWRRIA